MGASQWANFQWQVIVEYKDEVKYLGVTIDDKLRW